MTCRHRPGDPDCSKSPGYARIHTPPDNVVRTPETPDPTNYEIVDVVRIGNNLVLKVLYPNCRKCSFEGNKILVLLDVTETEALRWNVIDPHFRIDKNKSPKQSPSPAARFPATKEGWEDAIAYVQTKVKTK